MKLVCLLLIFHVLLLSLKPCCTGDDCQRNIFPKNELSHKAPPGDKNCQGCSPFFTCGTCVGFILATPLTLHPQIIAETGVKHYIAYRQPYTQQVFISVWQPPKLS